MRERRDRPPADIPNLKDAHPLRYDPADANAGTVQANWERFLRMHPRHRPSTSHPRRVACRMPCVVEQVAHESSALCRRRNCPGHGSNNERLRGLRDHPEAWHYTLGDERLVVMVSHPYMAAQTAIRELHALLDTIPAVTADLLGTYACEPKDDWYNPPHSCGVIIQARRLPAPRGWYAAHEIARGLVLTQTPQERRLRLVVDNG